MSVKQLSDEALRISLLDEEAIGENAFWQDIKAKCDEARQKVADEIEAKRDGQEEPADGWPEIDQSKLDIRVHDDIIYQLLKQELVKNACRNRGYILDGMPRDYYDAQNIFLMRKPKENEDDEDPEEEELEEGQKRSFDTGFIVN